MGVVGGGGGGGGRGDLRYWEHLSWRGASTESKARAMEALVPFEKLPITRVEQ